MGLVFEPAAATAAPDARRADVACFVGFVGRRAGRALPAALRAQLADAGWVEGLWRKPPAQVESLLNLPLALDSWHLFDRLYAWDERPVEAGGEALCATWLGAAVRSFFARGGRRAIVVRVGDPWPLLEPAGVRQAALRDRLRAVLPAYAQLAGGGASLDAADPSTWQGVQHLRGLRDCSMLLLPDLCDACAFAPPPDERDPPAAVLPEGFVECSSDEAPPRDTRLARIPAPRLDAAGTLAWQQALAAARAFVARPPREVMVVASLPLMQPDAQRVSGSGHLVALADMLAWLQRNGVLGAGSGGASAFVQLAWPWLATPAAADDLPEGIEPAEGALAGLVAAGATLRGCFRSVAGDFSLPRTRPNNN